jgi:hypothetical protein
VGIEKCAHLEEIGEIDEHVIARLFLPARNVETDGHDIEAFAAFGKLVFYCESV